MLEENLHFYKATETEVDVKESNIFIGVSLGKYLTEELAKQYLDWALGHGKKVAILIADEINAINYVNIHGYSKKSAIRKVTKQGDRLERMFQQVIKVTNNPQSKKVEILRWRNIETPRLIELKEILSAEFKQNSKFKKIILGFVDKYLKQRKEVPPEVSREALAEYILSELPTLLEGIEHKETRYSVVLYPAYRDSGLSQFVVDIQEDKYPELAKKLRLQAPTVMVEAYLEGPTA